MSRILSPPRHRLTCRPPLVPPLPCLELCHCYLRASAPCHLLLKLMVGVADPEQSQALSLGSVIGGSSWEEPGKIGGARGGLELGVARAIFPAMTGAGWGLGGKLLRRRKSDLPPIFRGGLLKTSLLLRAAVCA